MRRELTLPKTLLIAAPLLLAALPAVAEEAPAPANASEPIISIVSGLAPDDLLNIRATASALGKTEARLPSGTSLRNYGCNTINGYPWCKVEDLKNPNLVGWVPARYLTPTNPAPVPEDTAAPAAATATSQPLPDEPQRDIAARLGNGEAAAQPSAAEIGRTAMQDAYGLAFAAAANGESDSPASDAGIPCARHVGQPMTRCEVSVAHTGGDSTVTVTWPDGGSRVIAFHDGKPSGSDSPDEFRFTREGSLNMIRVGVSERFEITDTLALGD
jgi:hypothetical protein